MDKNTIIGFLLIAGIMVGFTLLTKPSEEEIARQKKYNDSIALVYQQEVATQQLQDSLKTAVVAIDSLDSLNDSTAIALKSDAFGGFSSSAFGDEKYYTLENNLLKLVISSKGGRIYSAELKKYKAQEGKPLILFEKDESDFNYVFVTDNNRVVNSDELYFEPQGAVQKDSEGNQTLIMRLKTNLPDAYIDFIYTLPADDYMVRYDMKANRMNEIMPMSINSLEMTWKSSIRQQEKGRSFEERYSGLYYHYIAGDMDNLNQSKNDEKKTDNQVKWVAFKDQFFSSVLIADKSFTSSIFKSEIMDEHSGYLKNYSADMVVPFDLTGKEPTGFRFYLGPNHYKTLSSYDKGVDKNERLHLRELISLGWFGFVNRYFVIPMFNFFSKYIGNFGIIILLMTIVIKIIILPLTYKSYMSSAKMRVLKPEIDEINARIPAEKAMERQQATMALYNKVGVSPMSGCIPSVLQMPLLVAMFGFFPAAIELRQESFLWVKDLSSYDVLFSWKGDIPLLSSIFGNHISLFALLMTITTIFSTKISMQTTQTSPDQPGAGMMKWMMYLMPIMFFFMFNSYASGLTYYYFLSSLFTVILNQIIRWTIDEDKLLAELRAKGKANAKNPKKKGGGFMARLEQMQKEQQKAIRDNAKRRN
ncbi:MAG: membrane protein insertase YidC [Paludibacteraceae bacterium]